MPAIDANGPAKPGFQSSENTGVEVTLYSHTDDPILLQPETGLLNGRTERDGNPSIVAVNTTKALNAPGQFSITVKVPNNGSAEGLLRNVADDDWVDIVFFQHDKPYHVLRGLVDEIRRNRVVSGSGATQIQYTITGRDFQKVWETTMMWFDRATVENIEGAAAYRVVGVPVNRTPNQLVNDYLNSFLREVAGFGRANWLMPPSMPGVEDNFIDSMRFNLNEDFYGDILARRCVNPNFGQVGGNLWGLATEWSDPLFTELYTDIAPIENSKLGEMVLNFRIKPFPQLSINPNSGLDSPYYIGVPVRIVPKQQIVSDDLGRSTMERFNAFAVAGQIQQEWMGGAIEITRPLWSPSDMQRHGKRTFDIDSKYVPIDNNLGGISTNLRNLVRDWYCINPYLLNGQISLGVGRPDVRIGERVLIPGQNESENENYYIESVSHSWVLQTGTRTNLGVTRGYIGSDSDHIANLETIVSEYETPPLGSPGT